MEPKSKYNLIGLAQERHSVRSFQKKEVPENLIKEIITVAQRASSWENSQPWNLYIATGEVLEQIRKEYIEKGDQNVKGYADMKPGHRTDFSKQSQKNMEAQNESFSKFTDDPKFEKFMNNVKHMYNAPMVIYFTLNKGYTPYNVFDIGGFGQVLMIAAKDYGIDSLVAYSLSNYPDVLRKYMKVPDDEDIVMGIAFGYEDDSIMNKFRSTRLPLDKFCHFKNKLE